MVSPIVHAPQTQSIAPPNTARPPQSQPQAKPSAAPVDTVQLSAAAKAMQEAIEAPQQTAREAAQGDLQAKHLLAKEAFEKE